MNWGFIFKRVTKNGETVRHINDPMADVDDIRHEFELFLRGIGFVDTEGEKFLTEEQMEKLENELED